MFSILQEGWPRLACVQYITGRLAQAGLCCRMAGLGWLVFSILQDGWPRLACVQYIAGWLAQAGLCSVVLLDG